MTHAYLYHPQTRAFLRSVPCQTCPKTGAPMPPPNSLMDPPPEGPDFLHIVAIAGNWQIKLESSRRRALQQVDRIHAALLHQLTGQATPEERDTWAPKASAARALLAGVADPPQRAMLDEEAQMRGLTPAAMAQMVLNRAAEFERLIGLASKLKLKAKTALQQAETIESLCAAAEVLQAEVAAAVASIAQKPFDA